MIERMNTELKRKLPQIEKNPNFPLLNHDSNSKRCKSVVDLSDEHLKNVAESQYETEEVAGALFYGQIRTKALPFLRTLMKHIFALPFVNLEKKSVKEISKKRMYLDDVCDKMEKGYYNNFYEIITDVNQVFDSAKKICVGNMYFFERLVFYNYEDLDIMAAHLRKELENFHMKEVSSIATTRVQKQLPSFNSLSESIKKGDDDDAIAAELGELELKHLREPKYRLYKYLPTCHHDFVSEKVHHSYIAGYQFHKMITKSTSAPIAMRTILNFSDAIESISYIENDALTFIYEAQRELFKKQGKINEYGKVDEMLLFHGTNESSIDRILSSNFLVDAMPIQQCTGYESRKKNMLFGRGVYFSEMPSVSLMFGNGLILCKVLIGSCEVFKPNGSIPDDIPNQFDSRVVQGIDKQSVIHVVKNPDQILPYCIIKLKNQSLTSEFVKPKTNKCNNVPTNSAVNINHSLSNSLIMPSSSSSKKVVPSNSWTIINSNKSFSTSTNKTYTAAETVGFHSIDTDQCHPEDVCCICLEKLSLEGFVFLKRCKHKFHTDCLVQVVAHQSYQSYLQCSICQVIYGQKTGNMPANGQMLWIKQSASLPGHSDCGLIVIKYNMFNGIQDENHPNPGKPYSANSFPRHAYLPDDVKGNMVLKMLITAFQRRLTFTIGRSITYGKDDCITWNGIHHKTYRSANSYGHGYPDPGYLDRVIEELSQFGIFASDY